MAAMPLPPGLCSEEPGAQSLGGSNTAGQVRTSCPADLHFQVTQDVAAFELHHGRIPRIFVQGSTI